MRSKDNSILVGENLRDHGFLPFGQMKKSTRNFSFFMVALLFFSGFATYFILLNLTPIVPTREVVVSVLLINAILVVVMMILILVQARRLFVARSKRMAGAQLHIKLVGLFSAIAAFPLLLMALFASFSLDNNLDHWFSKPVTDIVRSSLEVSRKYVLEKATMLGTNSKNMAQEFERTTNIVKTNPIEYTDLLGFLAPIHNIDSVYVIDNLGNIIAQYGDLTPQKVQDEKKSTKTKKEDSKGKATKSNKKKDPTLKEKQTKNQVKVPQEGTSKKNAPQTHNYEFPNQTVFNLANSGKPVVILPTRGDIPPQNRNIIFYISQNDNGIIRTLVKIKSLGNTYLYTQSKLDKAITSHLAKTRSNVYRYNMLRKRKGGYQVAFALMYIVVALTLLLAVIWVGFWFADKMVDPIRRLIAAAKKVSDGNLSASVSVSAGQGELADLGTMFNNMTTKLRMQRNELTDATTLINERRRFTEAVLSGVSAGIIGLKSDHTITLVNKSAINLLPNFKMEDAVGKHIDEVLPDFSALVRRVDKKELKEIQGNINLVMAAHECSFAVQVTREQTGEATYGYVITFDDITELLSAQKTAAWAEVAQRIAHEIKNPLTPIQLSTDRLKSKFSKQVDDEKGLFTKYTDTINRHVAKIRRRVGEFADFAKMADLVMEKNDVCIIVHDGIGVFNDDISYITELPDQPLYAMCNSDKLEQSILNLVKNASEAIEARAKNEDETFRGKIIVRLVHDQSNFTIVIIDNGCGLPEEKRNTLFDPYVTTRAEGTGLGLAIVKKIIEQHNGSITLHDAGECGSDDSGTCIKIIIPLILPNEKNSHSEKKAQVLHLQENN